MPISSRAASLASLRDSVAGGANAFARSSIAAALMQTSPEANRRVPILGYLDGQVCLKMGESSSE